MSTMTVRDALASIAEGVAPPMGGEAFRYVEGPEVNAEGLAEMGQMRDFDFEFVGWRDGGVTVSADELLHEETIDLRISYPGDIAFGEELAATLDADRRALAKAFTFPPVGGWPAPIDYLRPTSDQPPVDPVTGLEGVAAGHLVRLRVVVGFWE